MSRMKRALVRAKYRVLDFFEFPWIVIQATAIITWALLKAAFWIGLAVGSIWLAISLVKWLWVNALF